MLGDLLTVMAALLIYNMRECHVDLAFEIWP